MENLNDIQAVFWGPKQQIAKRDVASWRIKVSSSEYSGLPKFPVLKKTPFQLQPRPIPWFIMALSIGTSSQPYDLLKTYYDTLLLWESTVANSLNTKPQSRPSKLVKPITERHCCLIIMSKRNFIYICDIHDCCCSSNRLKVGHSPN